MTSLPVKPDCNNMLLLLITQRRYLSGIRCRSFVLCCCGGSMVEVLTMAQKVVCLNLRFGMYHVSCSSHVLLKIMLTRYFTINVV